MGRPKTPLTERRCWEIYCELRRWCRRKETIPTMHAFWQFVLPKLGYEYPYSTFRNDWKDLLVAGLLMHEEDTNAVIIMRADTIRNADLRERVAEIELAEKKIPGKWRKRGGRRTVYVRRAPKLVRSLSPG